MLTFLPLEEIDKMDAWEGSQLNEAKEILAYELTTLVHGKEEADKAKEASRALFGGGKSNENMPTFALSENDFTDGGINIMDLLVKAGLCPSKGEARRLIQQGGITVRDEKVTDFATTYPAAEFESEFILRKGKKVFIKITK